MLPLDELKMLLREAQSPFFSDEELQYYLDQSGGNLMATAYKCCLLKAEDDSISLPGGLSLPSNQRYWLTLAKTYRPNGSKIL